jgi:branched-chain amino acid transport system ATP-binding protein
VTGGEATFPLLLLFGLNAVDELDQAAYAVLLPDIRDHFGLGNQGILSAVAASTIVILVLQIPLAHHADRSSRVRLARLGAAIWAVFAFSTGMAFAVWALVASRIGAGLGKTVVVPVHGSLLSDYYPLERRVRVFSFHGMANSLGQIIGPLAAGGIAYLLGWRAPFLVFALPTIVLVVLSLRLVEPRRGQFEASLPSGSPPPPLPFREAIRTMSRIRTMRRIWLATPFFAVFTFSMVSLLALVYEDVFGVTELGRGAIAAAAEPAQILGILVLAPIAARLAVEDPARVLRFIAVVGVVNGFVLGALALAPNLGVAIGMNLVISTTISVQAPVMFALLSMVVPAHVRSLGFTTLMIFSVPGIIVLLPLLGAMADSLGLQVAMLLMVPVAIVAALILLSATPFIADDIARSQGREPAEVSPVPAR